MACLNLEKFSKFEIKANITSKALGEWLGGGEVSELKDRRGCAILALEVVPKNLIFA